MSDEIERRLRESLQRRADPVHSVGDWAELIRRSEQRRVRAGRAGAAAAALLLIVGPLAGYGLARATRADDGTSIRAAGRPESAGAAAVLADAGLRCGDGSCGPLEPLGRRDAGGVSIRAYRAAGSGSEVCDGPQIVGELSNEGAVTIVSTPVPATFAEPIVSSSGTFGVAEGSPADWAIVQLEPELAPNTASVVVSFAEGYSDETAPTPLAGGSAVAVLAAEVPADATRVRSVSVVDAGGDIFATVELTDEPECTEPTTPTSIPAPTSTVPTTAAAPTPSTGSEPAEEAARRAVVQAFEVVYAPSSTVEAAGPFIDDPHGLQQAIDETNERFPDARSTQEIRITSVSFTSATEAVVEYDWSYARGDFPGRTGRAVLLDGTWKVTRSTVCNDFSLAGVTCPP
jgi:hypothetical protein